MRSKIFQEVLNNTYRKLSRDVDVYAKRIATGVRERFHYYHDWKAFNLGIGFGKCERWCGWKYVLSFDLTFFSCWIYFVKIKK